MTDNIFGHKPPAAMGLPDLDDIDDDLENGECTLDLAVDWSFDYATMKFVDNRTGQPVIRDGALNPDIDFA